MKWRGVSLVHKECQHEKAQADGGDLGCGLRKRRIGPDIWRQPLDGSCPIRASGQQQQGLNPLGFVDQQQDFR
jgi:hypothetical protein